MNVERATSRYWTAYGKAIDEEVQKIIDQIPQSLKTQKNALKFRKEVQKIARYKLQGLYIDRHRDSLKLLSVMIEKVDFNGFPTNEVYDLYCYYCEHLKIDVIKKGYFTQFVCKCFDYIVIDERLSRLNGKKQRVFMKKAGV